jgi:hypothetical protein
MMMIVIMAVPCDQLRLKHVSNGTLLVASLLTYCDYSATAVYLSRSLLHTTQFTFLVEGLQNR